MKLRIHCWDYCQHPLDCCKCKQTQSSGVAVILYSAKTAVSQNLQSTFKAMDDENRKPDNFAFQASTGRTKDTRQKGYVHLFPNVRKPLLTDLWQYKLCRNNDHLTTKLKVCHGTI